MKPVSYRRSVAVFAGGPQDSCSVPAGEYFVLNDNRARMTDSRTLGFVPRSAIEGKLG